MRDTVKNDEKEVLSSVKRVWTAFERAKKINVDEMYC